MTRASGKPMSPKKVTPWFLLVLANDSAACLRASLSATKRVETSNDDLVEVEVEGAMAGIYTGVAPKGWQKGVWCG